MPGGLLVLALDVSGCRGVAPIRGRSLCRPGALRQGRLLPLHPLPTALAITTVTLKHGLLQAHQQLYHSGITGPHTQALAGWSGLDRA